MLQTDLNPSCPMPALADSAPGAHRAAPFTASLDTPRPDAPRPDVLQGAGHLDGPAVINRDPIGPPRAVGRDPQAPQGRVARLAVALGALLVVALGAGVARADNHFLLEGELGAAGAMGNDAEGDFGRSFGGTFGFGGRVAGFAPAYYLVGHLANNAYGFTGPARSGSAEVERAQVEYSIGGRIYLPLSERLRVLFQLGFGQVFDQATVSRLGHRDLRLESDAFIVQTQGGLQYRLNDHFSLGGVADFAFMPDKEEIDAAARAAGVQDAGFGRMRFLGTVTAHF